MILRYLYHPYVSRQCKETSLMPQWEDLEYPCAFHFFLMPAFFAESVYSYCLVPWGKVSGWRSKKNVSHDSWLTCVLRTDSGQEASGRSGWTKRKCAALPSVSPIKVFQSNNMPHFSAKLPLWKGTNYGMLFDRWLDFQQLLLLRFDGKSSYTVDYIPHPLEVQRLINCEMLDLQKQHSLLFARRQRSVADSIVANRFSQARDSAKPPKNVWEPGRHAGAGSKLLSMHHHGKKLLPTWVGFHV